MNPLDDLLQSSLDSLDQGIPPEQILAQLPTEAASLAPLILLAAAARRMDHPQMNSRVAEAQRRKVIAAARAKAQPVRLPSWGLALAQGLALLLVVAGIALGISLLVTRPGAAQSAQLADAIGLVEVAPSAASSDWHFVAGGERIQQGARVRTYADSSVSLVFQDGSRTVMRADTDLVVSTINADPTHSLQVHLNQTAGETSHNVIPMRGAGSFFLVDTPSGQASVQGTSFNVSVSAKGESWFAVTRGKVQVKNDLAGVELRSGQATSAAPGGGPQDPAYQFSAEGPIGAISANVWTVRGISITLTDQTDILGSYQIGDGVRVQGRILASGEWQADQVEPGAVNKNRFQFTGLIESMPGVPGIWTIGSRPVQVTGASGLPRNLTPGSPVGVTFTVLADTGGWQVREIESLEENNQPSPSATSSHTADATETSTLKPEPATETPTGSASAIATEEAEQAASATPSVTPKNNTSRCINRDPQDPDALRLMQRYRLTFDVVMNWFCKGFGFGEIDLAYDLNRISGRPVAEIFAMRSSGMSWGEIKSTLRIPPTSEDRKNQNPDKTQGPKK